MRKASQEMVVCICGFHCGSCLNDRTAPDVLEIPDSDDEPAGIDDEEGAATNGSSPPWDESASVAGYSDEEAGASGGYVNGEESLDGGMDLDDAGYDEDVDLAGEDGEGNEEDELLLHSDDSPHGTIGNYSQPLGRFPVVRLVEC